MEFLEAILILFLNFFLVACSDHHHKTFADTLSDRAILQELTHYDGHTIMTPAGLFSKHKPSKISQILKFQMEKLLRQHELHLNQGNMNRDHRKAFEQKLEIKFSRINNYSKNRLREEHKAKSRSIQSRKRLNRYHAYHN